MCHFPTVFPPDEGCDEVHVVDHDGQRIEVSPDMLPVLVGELVDYMTPEQKRDLSNRLAKELAVVYCVTFTEPPDRPGEDE